MTMPYEKKIERPNMTDAECVAAVERVLNRLDWFQKYDRYAMINAQQIRDLLDPGGLWAYSSHEP